MSRGKKIRCPEVTFTTSNTQLRLTGVKLASAGSLLVKPWTGSASQKETIGG